VLRWRSKSWHGHVHSIGRLSRIVDRLLHTGCRASQILAVDVGAECQHALHVVANARDASSSRSTQRSPRRTIMGDCVRPLGALAIELRCRQVDVSYWQIVLQKSKIERLRKSREGRFLECSAAAMLFSVDTKVRGRFSEKRCGPPRRCARNASAALENFVCYPQKTFSTASTQLGHRTLSGPASICVQVSGTAQARFPGGHPWLPSKSCAGMRIN
jgi:hypothetical protein